VIVAVSTVSIVAIAAVVIVALLVFMYVVPRGGRRRRPKL
jgi:Flp pilus assembly protein TadB